MARHGRKFLDDVNYSLHLMLEAPTDAELRRQMAEVRAVMKQLGAWAIAPTIPQVLSSRPFPPPAATMAASRFLPVHGIVPHSLALSAYLGVMDIFERRRAEMERLTVRPGVFSTALGAGAILIEPTWHWDAPFLEAHPRLYDVAPESLPTPPPNPEAALLVAAIRNEVCELFLEIGAAHLQIGRHYPFERSRNPLNWSLLSQFKAAVDQKGLMNPGVLGFSR
jgi:FAD/FMN-containing dehydrogenase